jgi:LysR family transcriptional regulator, transcriptional activator of the cysJI operon
MQMESLKVFCDLAETESFTKAAKNNNVTQSAVSQTISTLEKQFRTLLIERSRKNFRLTSEGEVLYDYSKRILHSYDSLRNKLQGLQGEISGSIRVATVYSLGLHELPPYVKRFLKDYPNVTVHLEYRRSNQVYEDVLGNLADLGTVAYPAHDPKLEITPFRKDSLLLICHPNHPFAKLKSIKPKALNGQKFINYEKDIPTRKALDKIFKQEGVNVDTIMELDNVETVKRAVEINSGVAIVPEETVKLEVASHTLTAVRLEGSFVRQLAVVYKKGKILSPAMEKFIELLKKPSP